MMSFEFKQQLDSNPETATVRTTRRQRYHEAATLRLPGPTIATDGARVNDSRPLPDPGVDNTDAKHPLDIARDATNPQATKRTSPTTVKDSLQVAGHADTFQRLEDGVLLKTTCKTELNFYRAVESTPLAPHVPAFLGGDRIHNSTSKKLNAVVRLGDVLDGMHAPCVADIKIGTRLYDDAASPEKKERMERQARNTTSGAVGLRICGMRVASPDNESVREWGREWGRGLSSDTIVDGVREFFVNSQGPGAVVATEGLIKEVRRQLCEIRDALGATECRLYGSSLLIAYDAQRVFVSSDVVDWRQAVRVKVIDFAHSHFEKGIGGDEGSLFGMSNLIEYLDGMITKARDIPSR